MSIRTFLLAVGALLLLGVAAFVVLYVATEPGSAARPAPPAPEPVLAEPPPLVTLPPTARPAVPPALQEPGPPVVYAPLPPKPPPGSWEAVTPVARPASLGPLGAAIGRNLNELQPRIAACFESAGPQGEVTTTADANSADHGVTVLVLHVETLAGKARIVDAPVETFGATPQGVVACAQRALRGRVIPAPQTEAGARHKILYTLAP
jgi:hypothetical protein